MPRCRIIKPDFWNDEKMSRLSYGARLTFIGLWNYSDDYGVCKAGHQWLKNQIYPYDEQLTMQMFIDWLKELEGINRIIPFQSSDENYYFIRNFLKHQRINRPSATRNPEPPRELLKDRIDKRKRER